MSEIFDMKAAEQKYLNNPQYHALVDALLSSFASGAIAYGDAFSAVELACRMDVAVRIKERGEK